MDNRAIGIFDSGVGGLSSVKKMLSNHPEESILYFGDTGRAPYGSRTREEIVSMSLQDVHFLRTFDLKAILIACNTITVCSLKALREANPDIPIIGVVDSAAEAAARATKNRKVGVIATKATIDSDAYAQKIKEFAPDTEVFSAACPKFVPLIEAGKISPENEELAAAIREYCTELKEAGVDTLILGCTHYPLIAEAVGLFMGEGVQLIDSGAEPVKTVIRMLEEKEALAEKEKEGKEFYFCSGDVDAFGYVADLFLKKDISSKSMRINIENF